MAMERVRLIQLGCVDQTMLDLTLIGPRARLHCESERWVVNAAVVADRNDLMTYPAPVSILGVEPNDEETFQVIHLALYRINVYPQPGSDLATYVLQNA